MNKIRSIEGTAIVFDRPGAGLPIICAGGAVEPIVPRFAQLKEGHISGASGEVVQQQRRHRMPASHPKTIQIHATD
jgi:hypothetical protein